jgi:hypothetical protein
VPRLARGVRLQAGDAPALARYVASWVELSAARGALARIVADGHADTRTVDQANARYLRAGLAAAEADVDLGNLIGQRVRSAGIACR